MNKSIDDIFSNSVCSLHVSVSHFGSSPNLSNFFIIIFVIEIYDVTIDNKHWLQCSINITFICTGKPKKVWNFIAIFALMKWSRTETCNIFEVCLYILKNIFSWTYSEHFKELPNCFPKVAVPFYNPTRSVLGLWFLHIFINTYYTLFSILAILVVWNGITLWVSFVFS